MLFGHLWRRKAPDSISTRKQTTNRRYCQVPANNTACNDPVAKTRQAYKGRQQKLGASRRKIALQTFLFPDKFTKRHAGGFSIIAGDSERAKLLS